ncbi:MAG: cupin domain-containing protein [Chloroflexi bacterium]|nr:cupin domain-containing protein [Chloroflexota bacterium]
MEKKEPYATQEEYNKRVVKYSDTPLMQLNPGAKNYIVSSERMTVSFVTLEPNIRITPHRHEPEQIVIVNDGACDFMVDGKLYHLEEGDVLLIPSNVEHGNYSSDRGLRMIEVFSPPRADLVAEQKAVQKALKT